MTRNKAMNKLLGILMLVALGAAWFVGMGILTSFEEVIHGVCVIATISTGLLIGVGTIFCIIKALELINSKKEK